MDNEEEAAPVKKPAAEKPAAEKPEIAKTEVEEPEVEINKGPVINTVVSEEIKADKAGDGDADLLIEREDSSLKAEAKDNAEAEKQDSKDEDAADEAEEEKK